MKGHKSARNILLATAFASLGVSGCGSKSEQENNGGGADHLVSCGVAKAVRRAPIIHWPIIHRTLPLWRLR